MFAQGGWFKCSVGRILNKFIRFACLKMPHVRSRYPGSLPTDLKGFKDSVFVERKRVCVCKKRAADSVITVTLEKTSYLLRATPYEHSSSDQEMCGEISKHLIISQSA